MNREKIFKAFFKKHAKNDKKFASLSQLTFNGKKFLPLIFDKCGFFDTTQRTLLSRCFTVGQLLSFYLYQSFPLKN